MNRHFCCLHLLCGLLVVNRVNGFQCAGINKPESFALEAANGFGGGGFGVSNAKKRTPKSKKGGNKRKKNSGEITNKPFVKSEQEELIANLAQKSASTCIGKAVAGAPPPPPGEEEDPFWQLMPSLISSRFPSVPDSQLTRIAGFVRHTLDPNLPLEDEITQNPHRPQQDIHAYMPGLGETKAFHDPSQFELCKQLSENYEKILQEYQALVDDMENGSGEDRFQSVTTMNYSSGWRTLVLFYNGHRIDGFPYHLCPTTTRIMESVPLAGRIAGFNRQKPQTGIPLHTDGNNMWLTCQMGIKVPEGKCSSGPNSFCLD